MHKTQYNVVAQPFAGSQSLALSCPASEILYEGTRGPGKTFSQLMRFRSRVGLGYGAFWVGVIFDLEYKNLGDIIAQSKKLFHAFDDGATFYSSNSSLMWQWPTGERLLFRTAKTADDYWAHHGAEYSFIGFNELTKRADSEFYEAMFSCMRSSFRPEDYPKKDGTLLPPIPLEVFSTTNPFGVGHNWVKKRFIDPVPRGTIHRTDFDTIDPKTGKNTTVTLTRVAIHGSWRENKFLDPLYVARLMAIKDPNKRKAWLEGSWDVTSGGRFSHLWDERVHIVKPFQIPKEWYVDRSYDWGLSSPFAVMWFAEADGCEHIINDKPVCYPKGTLFVIGEFYGGKSEDEPNKGVNMTDTNIAKVIKQVDNALTDKLSEIKSDKGQINIIPGIVSGTVEDGPADNAIFNEDAENSSPANTMAIQGVEFTRSDKSPGSRVKGAAQLCELLESALESVSSPTGVSERPAIYFFDNVRGIISRFPSLVRDSKNPDDIDCWVAGTMVDTPNGQAPIENIKIGDTVSTPMGQRVVTNSFKSGFSDVVEVTFTNGERITGTPNHQIYVDGVGLVKLKDLKRESILSKHITIDKDGLWKRLLTTALTFIEEKIETILSAE